MTRFPNFGADQRGQAVEVFGGDEFHITFGEFLLEAIQLLRSWPETKHIPVVALTAAATDRDRQIGEAAGFYRYLTKPVKIDENPRMKTPSVVAMTLVFVVVE